MADLTVRRLALRLDTADLLRALAAEDLDTTTLLCLAGRWADQAPVICWNPVRVVTDPELIGDLPAVTGDAPGAVGGGWFGWLSYSGPSWFGFFDRLLRRDRDGDWWLESVGGRPADELAATLERIGAGTAGSSQPTPRIVELGGTSRSQHLAAVEHAIAAIRAGELFQVNVCARLTATLAGSPLELFAAGLRRLAPDYAAFVQTPARTVVSFSPELFLHRAGDQLRTAPIKGTRRRHGSAAAAATDRELATELRQSAKDRAENVMIVDLMRNDLSRVCRPGTVTAPQLLDVRPAPGVWHLVSEVVGRLRPEARDSDVIAACFPPGSVTGAPKIRAQRLIDTLEEVPRSVFTGAIGYFSPVGGGADSRPADNHRGRAEFSVAIRTFEITGDRIELGVGGGITADSVPMQEWQECLIKAAPLLALGRVTDEPDAHGGRRTPPADDVPLPAPAVVRAGDGLIETMLAVDGRIVALADHLSRLAASCQELYRLSLPADLAARLHEAMAGTAGRHRIRLSFGPGLERPSIEVAPAPAGSGPVALRRLAGRTGSWRHKWADRRWLTAQERPDCWPLFTGTGPDGAELALETSRGNVAVICAAGVLRTPELGEDVLPGITRRRLLDAAVDRGWPVRLGPVLVADLRRARLVLSLSSIAGVLAVESLDGIRLGLDQVLLDEVGGWLG